MSSAYNALCIEGGGIKLIGAVGALKVMEQNGVLKNIHKFAGSSAGAITAGALSIGYTVAEMEKILRNTDFNEFKDDSWGIARDIYRLAKKWGFYKGDKFYEWYRDIVEKKTGNADITLGEIYNLYKNEIVVTGTCLNRYTTYYYHYKQYPDMPLAMAVRISMSIPLFFAAVKMPNGDVMVDGGVLCNYPIDVFDSGILDNNFNPDFNLENSKTLGIKMVTASETKTNIIQTKDKEINNIVDFCSCLFGSMFLQIERGYIRKGYWRRTICIDSLGVKTTQFSLTKYEQDALIESGELAAKDFFEN